MATLFPRSSRFGRYHLGHLAENENREVDVLAGAFMMVRREVLEKVGAFDEAFFMYGEDVDLSYRIQKAGYRNYYLAQTTIIHFKGESTRKGSLNYVRLFYQAMSQFVRKHYGATKARLFTFSIQQAIWMRAAVTAAVRFIRWVGLPFMDAALVLFSLWWVKEVWEEVVRPDVVYPTRLLLLSLPLFTLVYLFVAYYAGLYDRYYRRSGLFRATLVATLVLLVLYALLPEHLRFSRGIVVFGASLAFGLIHFLRWALIRAGVLQQPLENRPEPFILVAATEGEYRQLLPLFQQEGLQDKIIGRVAVNELEEGAIARLSDLEEPARALAARQLVLCAGRLSYRELIGRAPELASQLKLRFHAAGSGSIVGSDSSEVSGHTLAGEIRFRLDYDSSRRFKRLVDVMTSLVLLLSAPLHLLLHRSPRRLLRNSLQVLTGYKTWIGYTHPTPSLPRLRPSVLGPHGVSKKIDQSLPAEGGMLIDTRYAHDYQPWEDLTAIIRNYHHLGD